MAGDRERLADLETAIAAGAQMIMLDNFDDAGMLEAVTLAAGLAQRLEESGGRVLLVDLDPQGDAARALGLSPRRRGV